jgi:hypothetical protein
MKRKYKWKWKDDPSKGAELHVGGLRLLVHHYIGYAADQWFGTCFDLCLERIELGEPGLSLDEAKEKWLKHVTAHVDKLHQLLHGHD